MPKTNWLISINRFLYKGKKISLFLNSSDFEKFIATLERTLKINGKIEQLFMDQLNTNSDAILTSYNYDQLKYLYTDIDRHNYNIQTIGTDMFSWKSWKNLLLNILSMKLYNYPKTLFFSFSYFG